MTALTLTLVLASQISLMADYPRQQEHSRPVDAELFDTMAIVSPIRYHERELRAASEPDGKRWNVPVVVEEVKVLDSNRKLDEIVRIVHPFGSIDHTMPGAEKAMYRFQPGKRYLVWLFVEPEGKLVLPGIASKGADGKPYMRYFNVLERKHLSEVMGLAAFQTNQSQLDIKAESPIDRLMVNVARCAATDDTAVLNRSLSFLGLAQLGTFDYTERSPVSGQWTRHAGIPDGHPVTSVLEAEMFRQSPSNAARILSLLAFWNVKGAGRKLLESLRTAALDPELGSLSDDSFWKNARLGPDAILDGDESDLERRTKLDSIVRLALQAKSQAVRYLLLNNSSYTDDTNLQKQILELAIRSEEFDSMFFFRYLSRCAKDKELEPKMAQVGGSMKWVNRQQLIDFWKERLGLPPAEATHTEQGS